MYTLTQVFFKDIPLPIHNESDSTSQAVVTPSIANEKQEAIERCRSLKYQASPQTQHIHLGDGSYHDFIACFKYLGSFIAWTLYDDYNIKQHIKKANQAMGILYLMWNNDHLELFTKQQFFLVCVIHQLLWISGDAKAGPLLRSHTIS